MTPVSETSKWLLLTVIRFVSRYYLVQAGKTTELSDNINAGDQTQTETETEASAPARGERQGQRHSHGHRQTGPCWSGRDWPLWFAVFSCLLTPLITKRSPTVHRILQTSPVPVQGYNYLH